MALSGRVRRAGPSPHPWGKRPHRQQRRGAVRTIPTPVGKTPAAEPPPAPPADHPHTRGENTSAVVRAMMEPGPSPHPWGKRMGRVLGHALSPDHPHTRGENGQGLKDGEASCGPSPHPWGKPASTGIPTAGGRTIPTPVGKTRPPRPAPSRVADHPHTRGENLSRSSGITPRRGPSPHPWGKPAPASQQLPAHRTIPTPVGKTSRCGRPPARRSDHPHTRGENVLLTVLLVMLFGPSPHPWGKLMHEGHDHRGDRTIPTPVGKTG